MHKPGEHFKAAAVDSPWVRVPAVAGRVPRAAQRTRADSFGDRACAVFIIGLVVLMVAGWLTLGLSYLRETQSEGSAAVARIGTVAVEHPQLAEMQAADDQAPINIAVWKPVWIAVDLLVFVGLGLFLRFDGRRKQ